MATTTSQTIRIPPIRSIQEFIGGNQWSKPALNRNELEQLQKQIIANLIYFQSNYALVAIPLLLLVAFFCPMAIIFGLIVFVGLLTAFVYLTRQKTALATLVQDRPIAILVVLLVAAFMIIRLFGTAYAFLFGIVLPFALIIGHATARKPTLENKAANIVENLSSKTTPMGFLLGWLGGKSTEEQSTKSAPSSPPKQQ